MNYDMLCSICRDVAEALLGPGTTRAEVFDRVHRAVVLCDEMERLAIVDVLEAKRADDLLDRFADACCEEDFLVAWSGPSICCTLFRGGRVHEACDTTLRLNPDRTVELGVRYDLDKGICMRLDRGDAVVLHRELGRLLGKEAVL